MEGEAFFEVEKGSSFVVETEAGKVTVLGTSFNVRQRADALEVVCYTGKVGVSVEATEEVLTPGWEVRFEKGELVRRQNVDLSEAPTWLEGATPLEDVPLGEALQELVHVYGISLDYNEDLDSLRIRTIVPHDNLENALQLIMGAVDLPYDYDEKTRNLVVKGTGI
ncbi:MAG: FecR domain-containing protein [Bacteroidota bacterium]